MPLIAFFVVWGVSWLVILSETFGTLPGAPPTPVSTLVGQLVTGALVLLLVWLSRGAPTPTAVAPPAGLRRETLGLIGYLAMVVLGGHWLGLGTHLASVGLHDATRLAWSHQTPASVVAWAAYYGFLGVVAPLIWAYRRGDRAAALLLAFRQPRVWVPYCALSAVVTIVGTAGPGFYETGWRAHLVTIAVFGFGTFLPVMVMIQCLIAPRLVAIFGSLSAGLVGAGLVYGAYHLGEYYLTWTTPRHAVLSACWSYQFAYFGVLKAITTLRTANAWIHVFNTHVPHLTEAEAVGQVFDLG